MTDYTFIRNTMNRLARSLYWDAGKIHTIEIVSGNCRGADQLGELFAEQNSLKLTRFPAKWDLYGPAAGPIRNREMAQYAGMDHGILVLFWDRKSKGSRSMLQEAKKTGLQVIEVNAFTGEWYTR